MPPQDHQTPHDPSQPVATPQSNVLQDVTTPQAQPVSTAQSEPLKPRATSQTNPVEPVSTPQANPSQPVTAGDTNPSQPVTTPQSTTHQTTSPNEEEEPYDLVFFDVKDQLRLSNLPHSDGTIRGYQRTGRLPLRKLNEGRDGVEKNFYRQSDVTALIADLMFDRDKVGTHRSHQVIQQAPAAAPTVEPVANPAPEPDPVTSADDVSTSSDPSVGGASSTVEPPANDHAVYDHPYVKRLEGEVSELKTKYDDQVKETIRVSENANNKLIDAQKDLLIALSHDFKEFSSDVEELKAKYIDVVALETKPNSNASQDAAT